MVMDALGQITTSVYDLAGNVIAVQDALGYRTTLSYDAQGRPLTVMDALGHVTTTAYDSGGNVVVGFADPQNNGSPVMTIDKGVSYNSPHDLTILSGNSLYISGSLQNAGAGNITLVSGWNYGSVTGQNIIAAVQNNTAVSSLFSAKSSYGQTNNSDPNNGSIEIGCDAGDDSCSGAAA